MQVGTQVLRGHADVVGWLVVAICFPTLSAGGHCRDLLREISDHHRAASGP